EEAANFYVKTFKKAKITDTMHYGEVGPGKKGDVMMVTFEIEGQEFYALNGNPEYPFTLATSFFVHCDTQAEVDEVWDKLVAAGSTPVQCGWITDPYGMTWQIVPRGLLELLRDKDEKKATRAMKAMVQMIKLDINAVQRAYDGNICP